LAHAVTVLTVGTGSGGRSTGVACCIHAGIVPQANRSARAGNAVRDSPRAGIPRWALATNPVTIRSGGRAWFIAAG